MGPICRCFMALWHFLASIVLSSASKQGLATPTLPGRGLAKWVLAVLYSSEERLLG